MSRWYLGIDTSNYRTSAAIFDAESREYFNSGCLLPVKDGQLGLRQSDALFQHTLSLQEQIAKLPIGIGRQLQAICVSTQPRAVEGSYMPCFLAGINVARSVAHLLGIPFYTASHQQGHLVAAAFSAQKLSLLEQPLLAWHLSGGTTELLHVTPDTFGMPHAECVGGTSDIAAGQLIDRIGVLLGLSFPAGAYLEELANQSERVKPFPIKVKESTFSLSGMQNKAEQIWSAQNSKTYTARFVMETIAYAVERATANARGKYPNPVLCAGGVMSNRFLQQVMKEKFGAYFAEPALSGDNAVGTAILAAQQNGECLWRVPASIPSHN